jgi:hypothetical protein
MGDSFSVECDEVKYNANANANANAESEKNTSTVVVVASGTSKTGAGAGAGTEPAMALAHFLTQELQYQSFARTLAECFCLVRYTDTYFFSGFMHVQKHKHIRKIYYFWCELSYFDVYY